MGEIGGSTTACCGRSAKGHCFLGYMRTAFAIILIAMYPWRIFYLDGENKEFLTSMSLWAHHFTTAAYIMLFIEHVTKGDLCCKSGSSSIGRAKCTTMLYQLACVGQVIAFMLMAGGLSGTKKVNYWFNGPAAILILVDFAISEVGWTFRNLLAHLVVVLIYVLTSMIASAFDTTVNKKLDWKGNKKDAWIMTFAFFGLWTVLFVLFTLIYECKSRCR